MTTQPTRLEVRANMQLTDEIVKLAKSARSLRALYFNTNCNPEGFRNAVDSLADDASKLIELLSASNPAAKSCQTGWGDICHMAKHDGVTCPDDSCDIDDGIRAAPAQSAEPVGEIVAAHPVHGWHFQPYVGWEQIGAGTKLYVAPQLSPTAVVLDDEWRPAKSHCQNGGDVCLAGNRDGICCPEESCDIDDGVRAASPQPIALTGFTIKQVEGHGWIIDPPSGSRWIAHEGTPVGELMQALAASPQPVEQTPPTITRDFLGQIVREAWVKWSKQQPNPKPSWLVPYAELSEADKEADRQIGEAVAQWVLSIKGAKWEVTQPVEQTERAALAAALEAGRYTHASSNTERHRAFKDGWKQAMAYARTVAQPVEHTRTLTNDDVERQYREGIHIGSGLPRATCPCGFCKKHRFGFNSGDGAARPASGETE